MKCNPEGYETELSLLYSQFKSSLELFQSSQDRWDPCAIYGTSDLGRWEFAEVSFLAWYMNQELRKPMRTQQLLKSFYKTCRKLGGKWYGSEVIFNYY